MNPENTKKLVEKYPEIFGLITNPGTPPHYCISLFMFECGDGWYNIIDILCACIQTRIDQRAKDIEYRTKINDLVAEYMYGNREPLEQFAGNRADRWVDGGIREVPAPIEQVVASQMKEKYGGLRFYYRGGDDIIHGYVVFAECLSERTCDVCGAPGKQRDGGWVVTRCDEHV